MDGVCLGFATGCGEPMWDTHNSSSLSKGEQNNGGVAWHEILFPFSVLWISSEAAI